MCDRIIVASLVGILWLAAPAAVHAQTDAAMSVSGHYHG